MKRAVIVFVLILSFSLTAFANHGRYRDVKPGEWYHDAIEEMTEHGVIEGYRDGTFRPDAKVNRVEFAKMMVIALNLEKVGGRSSFKDIQENYWGKKYIETAKPYLTGFKSGGDYYFKPELGAQREDMAVALVKALNIETGDTSAINAFEDKDQISKNLRKYVAAAVREGLMQGYIIEGKRYYKPMKTITRAETAKLLLNVIKLEKITFDDEKVVPSDEDDAGDNSQEEPVSGERKATVMAQKQGDKIKLTWNRVANDNGFWGYKVVVSKYNPNPVYPADGYAYYISKNNITSKYLFDGQLYHGNSDFGKVIEEGETYYVSITSLYGDERIPGNVIRVTIP